MSDRDRRPNIVFILTDDQRFDAMGCAGNPVIRTPHMDALAGRGTRFENAFVTLSICSPSRAACLTGRYGSATGVTTLGRPLRSGEHTIAQHLRTAGYRTGMVGKWHLGDTPHECGFDFVCHFQANGTYYGRQVFEQGHRTRAEGYIDDWCVDRAMEFMTRAGDEPFFLWLCTQTPHMDHHFDWPASAESLSLYPRDEMPLPATWNDSLAGRPPYLERSRSREQALKYGYDRPEAIQEHWRRYFAAITDLDRALGRLFAAIDERGLRDDTWFVFMGDNGWFLGEHRFTSKVLPYEESIRVPMLVVGPDTSGRVDSHLALNIDLAATVLDIGGMAIPAEMHGRSLLPLVRGQTIDWRDDFLYEAPTPALGSHPLLAVRSARWKYVQTFADGELQRVEFQELYDLVSDPNETRNLAERADCGEVLAEMKSRLAALRERVSQPETTT